MSSAISSALSGLHAASRRVEAGAANIANARNSIPADEARTESRKLPPDPPVKPEKPVYEPVRVHQETTEGGGTRAEFVPVDPPHVLVYDPDDRLANDDGVVARPNVDLASEIVEMNQAEHAYKANLKTIATENAMIGALLNEVS
jgi:flagellar basal-body rod protein FlgC